MSGAAQPILASSLPDADPPPAGPPASRGAIALSAFLDQVADVLRGGLPERLWIEATVLQVRAAASGHTLELADPAAGQAATLRVFLAARGLATIRRDLGVPLDPVLLAGMTTCLLVAPDFTRRWHLGGRVEALSRDAAESLRSRLRERIIATLRQEKLWDRQRLLPRPRDITRLAVIHPAGAAGWGDIAGELGRWEMAGLLRVRSHPAPFEGEQAAAALVAALRHAVDPIDGHAPDLVLMVRGGGARASLAVLDEEGVARAILACPVPVVCGTGHAQDRGTLLAALVSWQGIDTPSKALALVAAIIRSAAQAAAADHRDIILAAATQVAVHERRLGTDHEALRAGLDRAVAAAKQACAAAWSAVRIEVARQGERIGRLDDGVVVLLRAALAAAPARVEAEERQLRRLVADSLDRAWRWIGRHDDGSTLIGAIGHAASARLDRQADAVGTLRRYASDAVNRMLRETEAELARFDAVIERSDIGVTLRRGFALVTDAAGRLLSSTIQARAADRLTLHFADGTLGALPGDAIPAKAIATEAGPPP